MVHQWLPTPFSVGCSQKKLFEQVNSKLLLNYIFKCVHVCLCLFLFMLVRTCECFHMCMLKMCVLNQRLAGRNKHRFSPSTMLVLETELDQS